MTRRVYGGASQPSRSLAADSAISPMAWSKASWFARDGVLALVPEIFRTNCLAAAVTSSGEARRP